MKKYRYRNDAVPNIPKPPPVPPSKPKEPSNLSSYQYEVFPIQLGMVVKDAANLLHKRLNDCAANGYRYCGKLQVNISEAVLIFEKVEKR